MSGLTRVIVGLAAVNRPLLHGCRLATVGLLAAISLVVAAGVFWRYALNDALSWYEEVSKYAMLWLTFTGAPLALVHGAHVAVGILPSRLPSRLKHALLATVLTITAVFAGFLLYYGIRFAWNGRLQVSPTIGEISMVWIFAAMPFGGGLLLLSALEQGLRHLAHAIDPAGFPEPADAEPVAAS